MLSFLRRTLGRRSIRKHAEKTRLREAQRATTHIPAAGDAKSIVTCRVSLLDGTDVSVDLPVSCFKLFLLESVHYDLMESKCIRCSLKFCKFCIPETYVLLLGW